MSLHKLIKKLTAGLKTLKNTMNIKEDKALIKKIIKKECFW